jgi:hypothetical protein
MKSAQIAKQSKTVVAQAIEERRNGMRIPWLVGGLF